MDVFKLISTGITVSWNPEELTKNFKVLTNNTDELIFLPNGEPHWQYFNSGIHFSRNFNLAFRNECKEIINILTKIQNDSCNLNDGSEMMNTFLNHKFDLNKVILIKVESGTSVNLHYDRTRPYSINIGLKNSNTCLTHIYSGKRLEKVLINENNVKHTIRMNDGDAYIIATEQPHSVESLTLRNENKDRYIISYCLV